MHPTPACPCLPPLQRPRGRAASSIHRLPPANRGAGGGGGATCRGAHGVRPVRGPGRRLGLRNSGAVLQHTRLCLATAPAGRPPARPDAPPPPPPPPPPPRILPESHTAATASACLWCRVRDDTLVELGVRLEDKPDGSSVWKPEDPAVLRADQARPCPVGHTAPARRQA